MPRNEDPAMTKDTLGNLPLHLPLQPLLSSQKTGWEGILVERHCQLPCEIPEHSVPGHIISFHLSGQAELKKVTADGRFRRDILTSGNVCINPAEFPISGRILEESRSIFIRLNPSFVACAAHSFISEERIEIIPQFALRDPLIQGIGLALCKELELDGGSDRLYAESLINTMAIHLLRHYSTRSHTIKDFPVGLPKQKLQRAVEYINDNLERNITLEEVAASAELSSFHFARLFKQSIGLAPHQYITECRIKRAKQLLANEELSYAEIAYQLGFATQSHFIKVFRKYAGVTPKAYRKAL